MAATTWFVNHNLGFRAPNVQLIDDGGLEFRADIDYVDDNNLTVTIGSAVAGTAYVS